MDIYWVGPRESDILHTNGLFDGSVTIYGDDKGGNRAFCNLSRRINHNSDNDKLVGFNKESLYDIINNRGVCYGFSYFSYITCTSYLFL